MAARYSTQNLNNTLTNFALDVMRGGGPPIVDRIAPVVRVGLTDTKFYKFNEAREFVQNWHDAERSPKGLAMEVSRSYTSATLSLVQQALRELIADEEQDNADMSVINPEQDAVRLILSKLAVIKEVKLAALLYDHSTTFSSYTAAASAYWDAGSGNTDIEGDIDAGKESVRKNAGVTANTIAIPPAMAIIAKKAPELRDLVTHTDSTLLVNGDLPPKLFGLDVVIPGMLQDEADPGVATPSIDDIHDAKKVWIGFVEKEAPSKKSISCFYRFMRPINGVVDAGVKKYREEARSGDWVEGMEEYKIEVPAPQAGYVISAVDA